ncbi:TetR/AcrR family transcriptional regulator [Spirosoma rhododendri]|uniref:TetR/AcrR family transcriptional regulator n=1 Tax=Spirosoma rhododendri TaxID=2728024 RepID=A0A7L5DJX0_9BACT|nr:TetR/AcrR family transcriptional regulator [Spirosoma rhododendri]QJD78744.1 TetR/AcrR family transcriptional regulator [Spirosoma rhododendri]
MSTTERRVRQKAEIRQRILDAARQIAREKDWNAVTIRSIADAIEYTAPIVYEHFENKEDVLLSIAREGHEEVKRSFDTVMAMGLNAEEKLARLSMVQWHFATAQPEVFRLMHNPERMEQQREQMRDDMQEARFRMESLFGELGVSEAEKPEIIFNWFCLMLGYINLITNIKPDEAARHLKKMDDPQMAALFQNPTALYERAIRRFLHNLTC